MKKKVLLIIVTILFLTSILAGIYIFSDLSRPNVYYYYYLLPISYAVVLILWMGLYERASNYVSCFLIAALYFFKFVILPVITSMGNYVTLMGNEDAERFIPHAIFLSIYEMICVAIGVRVVISRNCFITENVKNKTDFNKKPYKMDGMDFVIYLCTIILIIIIIKNPTLKGNFHLITNMSAQEKIIETRSWRTFGMESEIPYGLINTLLLYLFPIV